MKKVYTLISVMLSFTICFSAFLFTVSADCVVPGDVNSDGSISSEDARIIMRICVGIEKVDNTLLQIADVDSSGDVTGADARDVLRRAVGLNGSTYLSRNENMGTLVGYTTKNYPIYNIDGVTYIDGLIIVNKTYSLPENYAPGGLIDECEAAFKSMQKTASAQGLSIYISSAYRSYGSQKSIYNRYVARDGKKLADTYSARAGHSEHQTGLAIDLNTITRSFANTKEGRWIAEHCHEYGFIIRYPKGKSDITGYCYEPWHLRYVGIEKATAIAKSGLCLEEYYGITSEY